MSKHEQKSCPRCGCSFECKLNNPVHCDCALIELSEDQVQHIQECYADCLCPECLRGLASDGPLPVTMCAG